jgi:hypothetical protein
VQADNKEPELFISDRRTVELCADELRRGLRCILCRGHEGEHEGQLLEGRAVTWKR